MTAIASTVIDIGGTWVKVYGYKNENDQLILYREEQIRTPDKENKLEGLLYELANKYNSKEYIIGLPGPVRNSAKEIYCPPLNYSVMVDSIKKAFHKSDILITNDTIPFLISAECIYGTKEISIFTIGTSFGHSCGRKLQDGKILLLSFETAHIRVNDELLRNIGSATESSSAKLKQTKMNYMNYHILSTALIIAKRKKHQITDLIEAIGSEIAECEQLIPGSEMIIIEGGFGKWLSEREEMSNKITESISRQVGSNPRVVCGGVSFKKFRNVMYIRENYCSLGMISA